MGPPVGPTEDDCPQGVWPGLPPVAVPSRAAAFPLPSPCLATPVWGKLGCLPLPTAAGVSCRCRSSPPALSRPCIPTNSERPGREDALPQSVSPPKTQRNGAWPCNSTTQGTDPGVAGTGILRSTDLPKYSYTLCPHAAWSPKAS